MREFIILLLSIAMNNSRHKSYQELRDDPLAICEYFILVLWNSLSNDLGRVMHGLRDQDVSVVILVNFSILQLTQHHHLT